jgi:hypothetical protein
VILLTGLVLSAAVVTGGAAAADPLADSNAKVTALRQEADEAANAYFAALTQAQVVEARIADIEARLPVLAQRRRELREAAEDRAVAAYKRSGVRLAAFINAQDAMTAARRSRFLGRLNAADDDAFDALERASDKLRAQRDQLEEARHAQRQALEELKERGAAIDAKLQAAENEQHARAAQARPVAPKPSSSGAPPAAPIGYVGTPGAHPQHNHPFLVCTRGIESGGNYRAYNPDGPYMGAYQFLQSTWNSTANHAGRPGLVGVPPHTASEYDQDDMGWVLYQWQGSGPWGGRCD